MKKKRRAKKRKAIRSSRARYSKALLRAMRSRKRRKFSVSRRRIAANPNHTVRQVVADLQAARKGLKAKGWDVSDVSIGSHGEMIKVADSRGAYNILTHPRLRYHSLGHPTKASEWIVVEVIGSV